MPQDLIHTYTMFQLSSHIAIVWPTIQSVIITSVTPFIILPVFLPVLLLCGLMLFVLLVFLVLLLFLV